MITHLKLDILASWRINSYSLLFGFEASSIYELTLTLVPFSGYDGFDSLFLFVFKELQE